MLRFIRQRSDWLAAVALATWMTADLLRYADDPVAVSVGAALVTTLPLAARRASPIAAFVLVISGQTWLLSLQPEFDNASAAYVVTLMFSLYSVGRHARGRDVWLAVAALVALAVLLLHYDSGGLSGIDVGDVAFFVMLLASPWAAGLALRLREERETVLQARNEALRAERDEKARRAVAEERSRIARELHDVVSHAISVTVLQARGARRQLESSPADAKRALDAIEQTNTAALGDMRRLLAILRDTEGDHAEDHLPQPSLTHLDRLIEQVRQSGVPVTLDVDGEPAAVPPGVDLSAYRIVQEALTNVIKHAGAGAAAQVALQYRPDQLAIRVSDTGRGPRDGDGAGHGLIGIRERVSVVGGDVTSGAGPHGGFEIRATLPYSLEPV